MDNKIKAIIFDCDGTLVDSEYAHYLSWRHALQLQGGDLTLEEYAFYVGKTVQANARLLAEKIGSNAPHKIIEDKRAYYDVLQNAGLPAIQPTVDFVLALAKEKERYGIKLGCASAARKPGILTNLKHLKIDHLFDIVLSGQDDLSDYTDPEGVNKPKPYIYLQAAKLLRLKPEECLVIEDSQSGVTAGVQAGCLTIAIPNDFTRKQDLSHSHLQLDSLDFLSLEEFLQYAISQ